MLVLFFLDREFSQSCRSCPRHLNFVLDAFKSWVSRCWREANMAGANLDGMSELKGLLELMTMQSELMMQCSQNWHACRNQ